MGDMLSDGNIKVTFVLDLEDPSAPTVTELTAAGAVDLSCWIKADGRDHTVDEDTVDNSKLCTTDNTETPGRVKHGWNLTYNRDDDPMADLAYKTMKRGVAGFLIQRIGSSFKTAFAADDEVDTFPIKCGYQLEAPDVGGLVWYKQKLFVTAQSYPQVKVVAGA
jgi:hypothetical protein